MTNNVSFKDRKAGEGGLTKYYEDFSLLCKFKLTKCSHFPNLMPWAIADRMQIVEDFGSYLEVDRLSNGCKLALFALYGFYVEVWLNEHTDTIIKLNGFTSLTRLDLYLNQVDISAVYSVI